MATLSKIPSPQLRETIAPLVRSGEVAAPLGIIDIAAFDFNAEQMVTRAGGLPICVASKSDRGAHSSALPRSRPLADGPEAVREIRRFIDAQGWQIAFPLELRTTAPDDVALSTANGRESMYIAFHVPRFKTHTSTCQRWNPF